MTAGSVTLGYMKSRSWTVQNLTVLGTLTTSEDNQGATTITASSATALAVGRQGTTSPALQIDTATTSSASGIKITAAASTAGVAIAAIGGAAEALTIDAKGTGTVTINGTATGNIVLGRAATGLSLSVTGALTAKSATAVPATAGAVAAGAPLNLFSGGNAIWITSDAPTHTATKGDLCINTGGSSSSTRLFINNGTTTWIAVTTAT